MTTVEASINVQEPKSITDARADVARIEQRINAAVIKLENSERPKAAQAVLDGEDVDAANMAVMKFQQEVETLRVALNLANKSLDAAIRKESIRQKTAAKKKISTLKGKAQKELDTIRASYRQIQTSYNSINELQSEAASVDSRVRGFHLPKVDFLIALERDAKLIQELDIKDVISRF